MQMNAIASTLAHVLAYLLDNYGAIDLSLKQRQRITGNAFSNDMLWAVMYQWTLDPPALHTVMVSAIASP